jgi:hypothetical protein
LNWTDGVTADQMFWMHSDVEPEGGCASRVIDELDADALDVAAPDVDAASLAHAESARPALSISANEILVFIIHSF